MSQSSGVVLLSHGAARSMDDMGRYLSHVIGGREPPPTMLETLRRRYAAIGGHSPLNEITEAVGSALQTELDQRHGKCAYKTYFGFRHTRPFMEDVLATALSESKSPVVAVPLAPHSSPFLKEGYGNAIEAASRMFSDGRKVILASPWHMETQLLRYWSDELARAIRSLPRDKREGAKVIFTAHSLPVELILRGNYESELKESGEAIARLAGVPKGKCLYAWQSASQTGERWAGPDVKEVIRSLRGSDTKAVVVVPQGFVSDHLEILYDIDIEAHRMARENGLGFCRPEMPNCSKLLIGAVADLIDRTIGDSVEITGPGLSKHGE